MLLYCSCLIKPVFRLQQTVLAILKQLFYNGKKYIQADITQLGVYQFVALRRSEKHALFYLKFNFFFFFYLFV